LGAGTPDICTVAFISFEIDITDLKEGLSYTGRVEDLPGEYKPHVRVKVGRVRASPKSNNLF